MFIHAFFFHLFLILTCEEILFSVLEILERSGFRGAQVFVGLDFFRREMLKAVLTQQRTIGIFWSFFNKVICIVVDMQKYIRQFIYRLLMQRSHSLQSSLKRAGCRSSGKSVRFADWDGASLTRVRHLSADSVCQRNEQPSTSDEHDGNSQDIRVR